ncbi:hypothetical protein PHSY_002208 [Pseudozyma hubeiensis SY62]|uniref:Uncharacterized protein n=1 Tax=Pseudozyma hubeiensis (strain SY62) TaxID=1305764 RepID=R9P956_PSEHS|nr:hypothetical protein PHSY_002208 [Pseudozyma hubeiensis SY62]GAC94635.1 hypothetical protein PHSY_002208 [Pseudozyma hubeiensis SY62]
MFDPSASEIPRQPSFSSACIGRLLLLPWHSNHAVRSPVSTQPKHKPGNPVRSSKRLRTNSHLGRPPESHKLRSPDKLTSPSHTERRETEHNLRETVNLVL